MTNPEQRIDLNLNGDGTATFNGEIYEIASLSPRLQGVIHGLAESRQAMAEFEGQLVELRTEMTICQGVRRNLSSALPQLFAEATPVEPEEPSEA